jgi:hypothetical protein
MISSGDADILFLTLAGNWQQAALIFLRFFRLTVSLQGFAAGLHRSACGPDRPVFRLDGRRPALRAVGAGEGIALLSSKRSPLAPDVPTMSEAGVSGLDVDSWLGIFAPAKTPPEAIARLRRDIRASLPELKERFEKSGGEVWDLPDDKLDAFVASEYESWTKLIR